MSVRFLVSFLSLSLLFIGACTKAIKFNDYGSSASPEIRVTNTGDGTIDSIYLGKYKVSVLDPTLFAKTMFQSPKCSEYKMYILKEGVGIYYNRSYHLMMDCITTVNPDDFFPLLPWEEYIVPNIVDKKNYIDRSVIAAWYDIGDDFIFFNYDSLFNGKINYSTKTLINFSYGEVTITLYEKSVKGKEQRVVVAKGTKLDY